MTKLAKLKNRPNSLNLKQFKLAKKKLPNSLDERAKLVSTKNVPNSLADTNSMKLAKKVKNLSNKKHVKAAVTNPKTY